MVHLLDVFFPPGSFAVLDCISLPAASDCIAVGDLAFFTVPTCYSAVISQVRQGSTWSYVGSLIGTHDLRGNGSLMIIPVPGPLYIVVVIHNGVNLAEHSSLGGFEGRIWIWILTDSSVQQVILHVLCHTCQKLTY